MRELYPVNRKPYPTLRNNDFIKVNIDGYWYDAKITGVVRNLLVVTGVKRRLPRSVIPDTTPFKKNLNLILNPPKSIKTKYEKHSYNYYRSDDSSNDPPPEPETTKPWNWREGQGEWIPPIRKSLHDKPPRIRTKPEKLIYGSCKENRFNFRERNSSETELYTEETEKVFSRHLKKIEKANLLSDFFVTGKLTTYKVITNPDSIQDLANKSEEELEAELATQRLDQYFTIRDESTISEYASRAALLESLGYSKVILEENYFVHILNKSSEILRIENGPSTIYISPEEMVIVGPKCREVYEKRDVMTEEEKFENLKLIGKFLESSFEFSVENVEEEVPEKETEEIVLPNKEIVENKEIIKTEVKKEISKKIPKKPILTQDDDDYDNYDDDDYYSETSSQISYAESFHSIGEYYDNDEHYIVLEMDAQEEVEVKEVMEGPASVYETKMYLFEDQEIEFGDDDVKIAELRNLKMLLEEGFITKGEYIVRKNDYLNKNSYF